MIFLSQQFCCENQKQPSKCLSYCEGMKPTVVCAGAKTIQYFTDGCHGGTEGFDGMHMLCFSNGAFS